MIYVYSSNGCPNCKVALKTMFDAGVAFEERNVSEDNSARASLVRAGFMSVPAFEKNGKFTDSLEEALTWD